MKHVSSSPTVWTPATSVRRTGDNSQPVADSYQPGHCDADQLNDRRLREFALSGLGALGGSVKSKKGSIFNLDYIDPRNLTPSKFPELHARTRGKGKSFIVASTADDQVSQWGKRVAKMFEWTSGRKTVDGNSVGGAVSGILRKTGAGKVGDVTFYGHGRPGALEVGRQELTLDSFNPKHPHYKHLCRLRDKMRQDGTISLRACECFKGAKGRAFGQKMADFFNCRIVGHTKEVGGACRPGEVSFKPSRR